MGSDGPLAISTAGSPHRSVRPEWLFELSQRAQLLAWAALPPSKTLFAGLPHAGSRYERLLMRLVRRRIRQGNAASRRGHSSSEVHEVGSAPPPRSSRARAVGSAIGVLHEEFAKSWTLNTLARRVRSNRTDLEIGFRFATGQSVHDFLTRCRVDAAKRLLRDTMWSCAEVAVEVGYPSKSSFYANFKRELSMTPDEYRRRWTFARIDRSTAQLIVSHWSCRF
jgi:AraC-like DNA-binding protein